MRIYLLSLSIFTCTMFFAPAILGSCNKMNPEDSKPLNKIMGTGVKTDIKPLSVEDSFLEAVRQNDLKKVRQALKKGADKTAVDALGNSALLLAVRKTDNLKLIEFLYNSHPAAINQGDHRGRTPLAWVADSDKIKVVKFLLKNGADLKTVDNSKRSPVFYAAVKGQNRMLELLLKKGANPNLQDKFGDTVLMAALARDKLEAARILLKYGARTDIKNQEGKTAIDQVKGQPELEKLFTKQPGDERA